MLKASCNRRVILEYRDGCLIVLVMAEEEGEEGWAEGVFRISFPGIGGDVSSSSSRETGNSYASVRRCGADARARDQRGRAMRVRSNCNPSIKG